MACHPALPPPKIPAVPQRATPVNDAVVWCCNDQAVTTNNLGVAKHGTWLLHSRLQPLPPPPPPPLADQATHRPTSTGMLCGIGVRKQCAQWQQKTSSHGRLEVLACGNIRLGHTHHHPVPLRSRVTRPSPQLGVSLPTNSPISSHTRSTSCCVL